MVTEQLLLATKWSRMFRAVADGGLNLFNELSMAGSSRFTSVQFFVREAEHEIITAIPSFQFCSVVCISRQTGSGQKVGAGGHLTGAL